MGIMVSQLTSQMINSKYGRLIQHENGIIYFFIHADLSITATVAQEMVTTVQALDNSGQIRLLIAPGTNVELTFEAQRYFGSATGFSHLALVLENRLQAEVGQFLIAMMRALRSSYEIRLFHPLSPSSCFLLPVGTTP